MRLSWQAVTFTLKETFSIAYGSYSHRDALIVTLQKHNCRGYGECTAIDYYNIRLHDFENKLVAVKAAVEKQHIIQPEAFYAFLLTLELPVFLRSALDCAYWDLFGKLENKSFIELNAIPCDALPDSSITISVDAVQNQISKIESSAWTKFKVKCNGFDAGGIAQLAQLHRDIALDSNGSFTKGNCLWLQEQSFSERFSYLEQPMEKGLENYEILDPGRHANWMADEDCQGAADLERLHGHYRSVNIKLVKCGGLTPALELIRKAREFNFGIMIGCMTESTVGISAGAVLAPLCDYADLDGANLIANDIAAGSRIVNGKIELSGKPGLGIHWR